MCGIVAVAKRDYTPINISSAKFEEMNNLLTHRGPNDSGTRLNSWYGIGNRRLSIIDLRGSHQPIGNEDGTIWVVFNGEIFNFQELRRELISCGHNFRTDGDTEVIVHGYEEWGDQVVGRLRGQFAFALADDPRHRMLVARDFMGIKPLYYSIVDDTLVVASEIKSILAYPGITTHPYWPAVTRYLHFRYPMGKESLFDGIFNLEAGHTLTLENGKITTQLYWDIPVIPNKIDRGESYYVSEVGRLLRESVRLQMISDVPIGAYLSGGLDSSIVVALMSELSDYPVKTFTIGFDEDDYNEFNYAHQVADMHRTDHHEILLNPTDYFSEIEKLIRYKDAPLSVPNEVPLYLMSRELRKYITVVLSGEGADELFGGYGRIFRSPFDYQRMKLMQQEPDLLPPLVSQLLTSTFKQKYGQVDFPDPITHFLASYYYITPADLQQVLQCDFLTSVMEKDDPLKTIRAAFERVKDLDQYDQYMWLFQRIHLEGLLHRVDTTTMATSVEARVPFVDHKLVEFVVAMPFDYKIRWRSVLHQAMAAVSNADEISERYDITKYILRQSFGDILPKEIVERRKVGFPVPLHRWFGGAYNEHIRQVLLDPSTARWELFNSAGIEQWLKDVQVKQDTQKGIKLWMLMNLSHWLNIYFPS
jgi:asparagine synthase (glutamine-hydrolysing)